MNSDLGCFDEIYENIPIGVTIMAAKLDQFETLRPFCYSLKGAAIRCEGDAMFFYWQYSKRNWLEKGIQHFCSFTEDHTSRGTKPFLLDQRGGSIDRDVVGLLCDPAECAQIRVLVIAVARRIQRGEDKWLAALKRGEPLICSAPPFCFGRATISILLRRFLTSETVEQGDISVPSVPSTRELHSSRAPMFRSPRTAPTGRPHDHATLLKIVRGADSTDGLEITSRPLGADFPAGLMVAMNSGGRNFLLYRWEDVALTGQPKLKVGR